jgi:hypothetical protein
VDKLGALADIGTQSVLFGLPNSHETEVFELVADLVSQVRDL